MSGKTLPEPEPLIARLTTSERKEYSTCPQSWWWKYREGLSLKDKMPDARWLGTGLHEALGQWYRKGKDRGLRPDVAFAQWLHKDVGEDYGTDIYEEIRKLGEDMLLNYYRTYGYDEAWNFIATEQFGEVLVPQRVRSSRPLAKYSFTFDGVYRDESDNDSIWLLENKSANVIRTQHLPIDEQGGSYWLMAETFLRYLGILRSREHIAGIMYNFLRKAMQDTRPKNSKGMCLNKDGSVSKSQPPKFLLRYPVPRTQGEMRSVLQRIQVQSEIMLKIRSGDIDLAKNIGINCPWCDFFDMCQLHEDDPSDDGAWATYRDAMYTRSDPYAYQHKEAGE